MAIPTQIFLDRACFYWTEARLITAAIALFLGGYPPVLYFNPIPAFGGFLSTLVTVAWVISGPVSLYLLYRWLKNNKVVLNNTLRDKVAFFIAVVSGLNLGFAGIARTNIGMSLADSTLTFVLTGCLYLVVAIYLYQHWKRHNENLF
jgi:hypothetical protein